MSWENVIELTQALLITIPTTCITCMVYLECFRNRTGAEIHKAIRAREERERGEYTDDEPWRERSLLEGVDILESDIYIE
jgi:hypothetical protein